MGEVFVTGNKAISRCCNIIAIANLMILMIMSKQKEVSGSAETTFQFI